MSTIEQPILDYISGVVAEAGGPAVTRDTPLLEAGVLDSINLVRLVQFIEERFGQLSRMPTSVLNCSSLRLPSLHMSKGIWPSAPSASPGVSYRSDSWEEHPGTRSQPGPSESTSERAQGDDLVLGHIVLRTT